MSMSFERKKRLSAYGLALAAFVFVAAWRAGRVLRSAAPGPVTATPSGLPEAPSGDESVPGPLGYEAFLRLAREAAEDPAGGEFAAELAGVEAFRALWRDFESHRDPLRLLRAAGAEREFLERLESRAARDEPFARLVARLAERPELLETLRAAAEPAAAAPSGLRILATLPKTDPVRARPPGSVPEPALSAPPASFFAPAVPAPAAPGRSEGSAFSALAGPERARLIAALETGKSIAEACRSAGLVRRCAELEKRCRAEESCRRRLGAR